VLETAAPATTVAAAVTAAVTVAVPVALAAIECGTGTSTGTRTSTGTSTGARGGGGAGAFAAQVGIGARRVPVVPCAISAAVLVLVLAVAGAASGRTTKELRRRGRWRVRRVLRRLSTRKVGVARWGNAKRAEWMSSRRRVGRLGVARWPLTPRHLQKQEARRKRCESESKVKTHVIHVKKKVDVDTSPGDGYVRALHLALFAVLGDLFSRSRDNACPCRRCHNTPHVHSLF
jgi:hypothetical protein